MLLRLFDRRKATKGLALRTLVQRGDEDKMLKFLLMLIRREELDCKL